MNKYAIVNNIVESVANNVEVENITIAPTRVITHINMKISVTAVVLSMKLLSNRLFKDVA